LVLHVQYAYRDKKVVGVFVRFRALPLVQCALSGRKKSPAQCLAQLLCLIWLPPIMSGIKGFDDRARTASAAR
jgi:hypothetical protein